MFAELIRITERPGPFSRSTVRELWAGPHVSEMMLRAHLNGDSDAASRRTSFIDASVAWIGSTFRLRPGIRVADLGCGPGLYANRLALTGADVTGIDFSSRSIDHARAVAQAAALQVDYVAADYLAYDTDERFDLVLLIYCDYCALGPGQRAALLKKVYGLLEPGGALLFDVHSLVAFEAVEEQVEFGYRLMNGFWSAELYFGFHTAFRYERERVGLDRYEIVEAGGTRAYFNWLQYFDRETLAAEVRAAGFEVEAFFADVAGRPLRSDSPEIAVVARRPGSSGSLSRG